MSDVSVVKCSSYDDKEVKEAIEKIFELNKELFAGIKPDAKVLLKPNLLLPKPLERAVTTHPVFIQAVASELIKRGFKVLIGDSPGGRSDPKRLNILYRKTGIFDLCKETGAEAVFFEDGVVELKNSKAKIFKEFPLTVYFNEVDLIISLPKLKTHGFMMLTAAVKNNFGLIPGYRKPMFHLKVPERDLFAEMLIDLASLVDPALTIVDGIVGMEGDGPSSGNPVKIGLVIACEDQYLLDMALSKILNFNPEVVPTIKASVKRGLVSKEEKIKFKGAKLEEIKVKSFTLPKSGFIDRLPGFVVDYARDKLTPKPVVKKDKCVNCLICYNNCFSKAIKMVDKAPSFDYERCIRCYCCHELCPESAIDLVLPRLVELLIYRRMSLKV